MHLDEEQVHRLVDGELPPAALTSARAHLGECPECRARVAVAEWEEVELNRLLRAVDHPPPRIDVGSVVARAAIRRVGWARRAAVFLATLGVAGVAYAAPGSPVPGWVDAIVAGLAGRPLQSPPAPPESAPQAREPAVAGIAVAPGRSLLIRFASYQPVGQIRVALTDDVLVEVRSVGGGATFSSEVDRLVVDNQGSTASFEIRIPREAARIEIRVEKSGLLLKQGDRIVTNPAQATSPYVLPLQAPRP